MRPGGTREADLVERVIEHDGVDDGTKRRARSGDGHREALPAAEVMRERGHGGYVEHAYAEADGDALCEEDLGGRVGSGLRGEWGGCEAVTHLVELSFLSEGQHEEREGYEEESAP